MSTAPAYQRCIRSARELCDALRAQGLEKIPTSLRNDIGRFKVWALNAGAHRKSTNSMSLDHRLREASDVKNMVVTLLEDLKVALQDAMSAAFAAPVPDTEAFASTYSDAVQASCSSKPKSEDSNSNSDSDFEDSNEFEQCLLDITNIVTCLYNLSIAIANPAPRDRLEKCASIDVSHFHQHDIEHVSYKFPEAEEYLIDRLGKANSKRRQLLRYYERHHERIAGQPHGFDSRDSESLADTTYQTVTTVSTYVPVEGIMAIDSNIGLDDDPEFDSHSVTSYASSIGNPERLRVPPPPNEESAFAGIPFECPYCIALIKVENQQSWKRHVFRDLRPYVCTFQGCQRSEHLFESRHEWFEHERALHRREWFCSACQELFHTGAAFQNHLFQTHTGQFDHQQQQAMIDRSERAVESKQQCSLCEQNNLSPHLLQRHMGHHMQQISLFVVPRSGVDEEESDKGSSESADPNDRSDDEKHQAEDSQQGDRDFDVKDPSAKSEELHWAASNGHEATVRLLLDRGAEIEAKGSYGGTALYSAASNGHEATVRLLLDRGAEIEAKDSFGRTALYSAARNGHEATVRLLLDRGAEIEAKNSYGGTALYSAASNGHEATVRLLLDRGAEIEAKRSDGRTALYWAARNGHEATVRLLLDRGATENPPTATQAPTSSL